MKTQAINEIDGMQEPRIDLRTATQLVNVHLPNDKNSMLSTRTISACGNRTMRQEMKNLLNSGSIVNPNAPPTMLIKPS